MKNIKNGIYMRLFADSVRLESKEKRRIADYACKMLDELELSENLDIIMSHDVWKNAQSDYAKSKVFTPIELKTFVKACKMIDDALVDFYIMRDALIERLQHEKNQ